MSELGKPKSDFSNIKNSGRECVGCGRGPDKVMLMRLRSYSRSLCCGACFIQYATCENKNPVGTPCHHEPAEHLNKRGPCRMAGCGCPRWIHGLESEHDRQLAAAVGQPPLFRECQGYGANLGKCGRGIFAKPDGTLSRLCDKCELEWTKSVMESQKEVAALLNLDTSKGLPN